MADQNELDRRKSAKSAMSSASNASMLKRWKSFVKPFAAQDSCDHCGRGSCDNGFEAGWVNGVPSVRPRTASKMEREGWPRAFSDAAPRERRSGHAWFASSQAISPTHGFRVTYALASNEDEKMSSRQPNESRGSDSQSSHEAQDDAEDDDMGLAQQRRSKRYSQRSPLSPLSPTFSLGFRERNNEARPTKSILKRESIRLSALPAMPRSEGSRKSFPAGQGMASFISSAQKSPGVTESFVFPRPPGSDYDPRSPSTPRLVAWNGLLDPENPQNRPVPAKLLSTILLLGLTFTVTFSSVTLTPASLRICEDFDTSSEVVILASALTVLGFAFGAPIAGALSEKYGRKRPLLIGLAMFALFAIPIGVTANLPTLLAFRFFSGVFGAAIIAVVPAALSDLWSPVGRGIAISFFAATSIIGLVVGGIAGSYLAVLNYPSWRWTAWITIGLTIFFGLPFSLLYQESSASLLLRRKANHMRLATKDWAIHAPVEESGAGLKANVVKMALVLLELSMLLPALHMSFAAGVLNLMFVSYGFAFRTERLWLRGTQDLPLVPLVAGCFIGIFINFIISKKKYTPAVRQQGSCPPENRLIPWIIGAWVLPIGLLVFAWTSAPEITFVPQIMAGVPSGIGISLILIGGLNYTIDAYIATPNLAMGATTFVRSAIAFAFPLFATPMYSRLGVDWGNTTLAIIAVLLVPIPILLMKLGPRLRRRARFAVKPDYRGSRAEMAEREGAFALSAGVSLYRSM